MGILLNLFWLIEKMGITATTAGRRAIYTFPAIWESIRVIQAIVHAKEKAVLPQVGQTKLADGF